MRFAYCAFGLILGLNIAAWAVQPKLRLVCFLCLLMMGLAVILIELGERRFYQQEHKHGGYKGR
jgi:hypothetical protein